MIYWTRDEVERIGRAGSCMWVDAPDGLAFRYLSSFWLYVEQDDQAFTPHGVDGFWEAWITAWVSQKFDSHGLFLDVGANVGYYTLMAAKHGMTVISFEPNPRVADMLRASLRLNREENSVFVDNHALGDSLGVTNLIIPDRHSGGAHISDTEPGVEVTVLPLDSYRFSGEEILMKVDAEGAEPEIWAGMQQTLRDNDVTVFLEWESSRWPNGGAEDFARSLFKQKYVGVIEYDGTERQLTHPDAMGYLEGIQTVIVRNY